MGVDVRAWSLGLGRAWFINARAWASPANTLMPYTYSFMIFLTIESYIVFAEFPDRWTLSGASIVVISGLIIWKRVKLKEETQ